MYLYHHYHHRTMTHYAIQKLTLGVYSPEFLPTSNPRQHPRVATIRPSTPVILTTTTKPTPVVPATNEYSFADDEQLVCQAAVAFLLAWRCPAQESLPATMKSHNGHPSPYDLGLGKFGIESSFIDLEYFYNINTTWRDIWFPQSGSSSQQPRILAVEKIQLNGYSESESSSMQVSLQDTSSAPRNGISQIPE